MYTKHKGGTLFVDLPFPPDFSSPSANYVCLRGWDNDYDEEGTLLLRKDHYTSVGIGKIHFLLSLSQLLGGWGVTLQVSTPLLLPHPLRDVICVPRGLYWNNQATRDRLMHDYFLAVHDYGLSLDVGSIQGADVRVAVEAAKAAMEQFVPSVEDWLSSFYTAMGVNGWDFLQGRFDPKEVTC